MTRLRSWAVCAASFLALIACGGESVEPAEVVHLAELYSPPPGLVELGDGGRAHEQRFRIPADAWKAEPSKGLWSAPAPWYGGPLPVLMTERASLVLGGDMALRPADGHRVDAVDQAGEFGLISLGDGDYVFARMPGGAEPAEGELVALVSAGRPGRARASGARAWRLGGGHLTADGFLVRADAPAEVRLDVPPRSALVFDAACIGPRKLGPVTVTVRLDGEPLGEVTLDRSPLLTPAAQRMELPRSGRPGARLTFEADGDAWTPLFTPRVVPAAPGEPRRPDIVVFLADTLRADSLAFYGGPDRPEGLTPALDAFADTALRAEQAWAPSCWTLPSHASLFLGVQPMQHGATSPRFTPAESLVSVAERLQASGYRTAAVTDGLFVSRRFDLDRGFEHFEEYKHGDPDRDKELVRTIERGLELAGDSDGRPLFLFVHTYRTHEPYAVSPTTRAELGAQLNIQASWADLAGAVNEEILRRAKDEPEILEMAQEGDLHELLVLLGMDDPALVAQLRALYLGGVRDLDRLFGRFVEELDRGDREPWIVFTSDHGEAFGEHDSLFHGFGAWEENLRVPLLIRGPGLEPRTLTHPVTLVDLPHTLAEIAGVAPHLGWTGRSLLSLKGARPVFAFDCAQRGEPTGALLDGDLKVMFPADEAAVRAGEVVEAYDLGVDPFERNDLAGEPRSRSTLERLASDAIRRMQPLAPAGEAVLDEGQLQAMQAMGYSGKEEGDD